MTDDLRTTLHRLADSAPPLAVGDDLWQRGRAARRRALVLAVAAVLTILASVGGVATLVSTNDHEARTASSEEVPGGAIPSRIDDIDPDQEVTSDLAVGRGSAAFVSATGDPVVITAADGVAHRLALPSWNQDYVAPALSPDGRRLVHQQAAKDGTRVTVLDLDTGRETSLLVHAGEVLKLDAVSWSPRGTWIGWVASATGDLPGYAGRIRADGRESQRVATPSNVVSVAVADDGTSAIGRVDGGLLLHTGDRLERVASAASSAGAFSPDGSRLALGSAPDTASYTLDVGSRKVLAHPFPDDTIDTAVVRPLGWLDNRLQLLLVQELDGEGGELVVTTSEVGQTSTWRRSVGSIAPEIANTVSLAVDLIPSLDGTSSQQLTHDFGDVLAPDDRDISWIIGLGVAAAIAVLMGLRLLWRRLT